MKKTKYSISSLLLVSFTASCAGVSKPPLSVSNLSPAYEYKIQTSRQKFEKIPSSDLKVQNQNLVLKNQGREISLPLSEIKKIEGRSYENKGNYRWEAAGIGALVTGVGLGLAAGLGGDCGRGSSWFSTDCENLGGWLGLGTGVLGALAGGLAGYGAGHFIPKKDKVQVLPTVDSKGNLGGALSFQSEF